MLYDFFYEHYDPLLQHFMTHFGLLPSHKVNYAALRGSGSLVTPIVNHRSQSKPTKTRRARRVFDYAFLTSGWLRRIYASSLHGSEEQKETWEEVMLVFILLQQKTQLIF